MQITKEQQCRGKKEKKPNKKPSKSKLNRQADIEWSANIKHRAGYKCELCGSTQNLNSHHVFTRRNYSVRWDMDNGVCLCPSHHLFSTTISAHKAPLTFIEWIRGYRGEDWYVRLREKAIKINK